MNIEDRYMRRAIRIARLGSGHASPNPMVGAVIVAGGRIIGEGYHRACGGPHAEVNAIGSVSPGDAALLRESTMYVTLEPCSHYGKTPPCSKLLIEKGIPQVAVGCADPFKEVSGRGIRMLRDAGVEVAVGVLERECRELNRRFLTAHTLHRPYITLKWAESSDGFVDGARRPADGAARLSSPATQALVHKLRSEHDAIMIGAGTLRADNPSLTVRHWSGRQPLRVVVSHAGYASLEGKRAFSDGLPTIAYSDTGHTLRAAPGGVEERRVPDLSNPLGSICRQLYEEGVTSLLVEGGPALTGGFIERGLWDEARIERSPQRLGEGVAAPPTPRGSSKVSMIGNRLINNIMNPDPGGDLCFV